MGSQRARALNLKPNGAVCGPVKYLVFSPYNHWGHLAASCSYAFAKLLQNVQPFSRILTISVAHQTLLAQQGKTCARCLLRSWQFWPQ